MVSKERLELENLLIQATSSFPAFSGLQRAPSYLQTRQLIRSIRSICACVLTCLQHRLRETQDGSHNQSQADNFTTLHQPNLSHGREGDYKPFGNYQVKPILVTGLFPPHGSVSNQH